MIQCTGVSPASNLRYLRAGGRGGGRGGSEGERGGGRGRQSVHEGEGEEGAWGCAPETVGGVYVEGGGEKHWDAVLFALGKEGQVLQRQRAAAVRDGGGGELLVLLLAADNAKLQVRRVSCNSVAFRRLHLPG